MMDKITQRPVPLLDRPKGSPGVRWRLQPGARWTCPLTPAGT
jgi:hypothetical protein